MANTRHRDTGVLALGEQGPDRAWREAVEYLPEEEYRVLSKGASGGGFMVPVELAESVLAAARAASAVGQVAQ